MKLQNSKVFANQLDMYLGTYLVYQIMENPHKLLDLVRNPTKVFKKCQDFFQANVQTKFLV